MWGAVKGLAVSYVCIIPASMFQSLQSEDNVTYCSFCRKWEGMSYEFTNWRMLYPTHKPSPTHKYNTPQSGGRISPSHFLCHVMGSEELKLWALLKDSLWVWRICWKEIASTYFAYVDFLSLWYKQKNSYLPSSVKVLIDPVMPSSDHGAQLSALWNLGG